MDSATEKARLEAERAQQEELRRKLEAERDEYKKLYLLFREENERLKRGLLGQKAERAPRNDAQLSLAILDLMEAGQDAEDPDPETEKVSYVRKKQTGRRPIPDNLPRVVIELLPDEVKKEGLDAFEKIGVEVNRVVERRPSSMVVVEFHRLKFVRKDRERNAETKIAIADRVEMPIQKGAAGPGLLADSIVRRWQDHLPLNRLEGIYAREMVGIPRSTMCDWHMELEPLVRPVVDAMREDALQQPYLCMDATGVLVQAPVKCEVGHFWVVAVPDRHVLMGYTRKHDGDAVDRQLAGYKGYLVADAHSVYDHLYEDGRIVEVGCWAHARRYFFKAIGSDPDRARAGLEMIGALFKIERDLVSAPRKKRDEARTSLSKPIVEKFFRWCAEQASAVIENTPIADAIRYAMNQKEALHRFLDEPMLPLHNNISELQLRREVIGRKNWLFVGSDEGGAVNAAFVTLLASCAMHKIEPWSYMRDLLCLLPSWPKHKALDLSPLYWKTTVATPETQQLLAANPLRAITLVPAA